MNIGITGSFDRLVIMDRIVLSRFLIGSRTLHDGLGGVCRPFSDPSRSDGQRSCIGANDKTASQKGVVAGASNTRLLRLIESAVPRMATLATS
jgi:hypothetical protein